MKMAKKLLAVVLTGVMAVSMLTGCASISSRRVADELQGMLKAVNDKATVKAVDDDLANKAAKVAKQDNKDALKDDTALKAAVKTELTKNNKLGDSYIWVAYFTTKDVNKTVKAQKIAKELIGTNGIDTSKAINKDDVKVGEKKGTDIEAGNKFELSMKPFTVGGTDYVMFVVTCKAQVKAAG
ncbi:MAG: hypothetical protein JNG54_00485 [Faecalibacterium prausnitzii]|nr:hypothetical protein [Faecalibacterium prausnitzii]